MKTPLVHASQLELAYGTQSGRQTVIGPLNFSIQQGEALGIIGESGAGKSTVGFELLGLLKHKGGRRMGGRLEYHGLSYQETAFIPQDPLSALDPLFSIGSQMKEVDPSMANIENVLKRVHLPLKTISLRSYPHELSGGMRQRLVIAMALLRKPRLLIADEPTSSLDMLLQAEILKLFQELHQDGLSFVFITHHLPLAASFCDKLLVMQNGKIVEEGQPQDLFERPRHPMTQLLIRSIPVIKT